jgi:hypothetical protein
MNKTLPFAGLLIVALGARDATAQWNVARLATRPNRVYTSMGIDPAIVTTVGFSRVVPIYGQRFQIAADIGIAGAQLDDPRDYRARLSVMTSILHWRSLHFAGSATFITRGTENSIYRGFNFGADFTGTAGVYRPGWFIAGEFGFDKAVITHVKHSDWYRTYFYADAKDGWYLTGGGTFHYGVNAGVAFGPFEVGGRFGWLRTEDLNELTPSLFGSLGVGIGF